MKRLVIALAVLVSAALPPASAVDVYLSLSSHGERMELGVAGFAPATPTVAESRSSRQIQETVENDLLFSRYFNLVEDGPLFTGNEADLQAWGSLGATVLIAGTLKAEGSDVILTARLLDVESRQPLWEKVYRAKADDLRPIAHALSDDVILRFTGEKGIAHTKIAFVNNQTREKELYLVDYDGHNVRRLTYDRSLNILPRWSPDGDEIAFTTYRYGNPDLYAVAPSGGKRRPVSRDQGLNTTPAFSPDGERIVLTMSRGGNPGLWLITRYGQRIRRISTGRGIETSPSFAPNGREIVFISDRSGIPQLYIMSLEGGNVRRLSNDGYCDSPAWSPRGDRIAFAMREGRDNYDIYVLELATGRTTRLTQGQRNNENPSWSPDGRFIAFTSNRSGRNELYVIAADGSGERRLADIPGNSFTPSWSP